MITPLCRFTYAYVWEPKANLSGAMKYSCGLMFPKSDTKGIEIIKHAIDEAINAAIAKGTFNKAASQSRAFKYPLRDGDQYYAEAPDDSSRAARECFRGHMFLSASNNNPIGVVDKYAKPIVDQDEFYSGCWGHADIRFYGFSKSGSVGVGVGLNNVMKKRDDDRLDGRQSAESAFSSMAEKPGEDLE